MISIPVENLTWQQAAKRWAEGNIVWTVALGGLGPSYEQCIQILVFETMARWPKETFNLQPSAKGYPDEFNVFFEDLATKLDHSLEFSGNQVEMAKHTAWQFMHFGYEEMLAKAPRHRKIMVQKKFPNWEGV